MGTCCSSENRTDDFRARDFEKIVATNNIDDEFVITHGPKSSIAAKSNNADAVRDVHEEMSRLRLNHQFDDHREFGENLGPYHYTFENSIYYGQYQNGLRHGLGIYLNSKEGFDYEGVFNNDEIKGKGAMITKDRDYLVGSFEEGEPHGQCVLQRNDGLTTFAIRS